MKKITIIIVIAFLTGLSSFAQNKTNLKPATIIIVHGSWSSANDWGVVVDKLKAYGHQVMVVNLAGHGTDQTPLATISLQGYVDAVKKAIGRRKDVLLVGHSFGGIVTSVVAEQIPDQIKKLIYVAAYVPRNGESLLSIANTDSNSLVPKYLQIDEKSGVAGIAKEGVADLFLADAPKSIQDYVTAHFRAEPLAPLVTPVALTDANFGRTVKVYVHTFDDRVNSYSLQLRMVKATAITRFYGLPSSHTPFVSMPLTLAAVIDHETY